MGDEYEELYRILRSDTTQRIRDNNQIAIMEINLDMNGSPDLETKMKILCSTLGHTFMKKQYWIMSQHHELESVEAVVLEHWMKIRQQVTIEMRRVMLDRCIGTASSEVATAFNHYADQILPV